MKFSDWKAASVALEAVKMALEELVSSKEISPLEALNECMWLLHWSLFDYLNAGGLEKTWSIYSFWKDSYHQAITTNTQQLLQPLLDSCSSLVQMSSVQKVATSADTCWLMKNLINVANGRL